MSLNNPNLKRSERQMAAAPESFSYGNKNYREQEIHEEDTLDLTEFWDQIKSHIWMLILLTIVGILIAGGVTWAFIPKTYASSGTLFLTPKVVEGEVDYNSINTNQKLVTNVTNLLTQDNIMSVVAQDVGADSAESVRSALTITNIPDTEIITITATTQDAKLSKDIVQDTIDVFIDTMQENLNVQNIQITDAPKLSYEPVGPNLKRNALLGGVAGLGLGLLYLFIYVLKDKRLRNRDEVEKFLGLPVYAEFPDLDSMKKRK